MATLSPLDGETTTLRIGEQRSENRRSDDMPPAWIRVLFLMATASPGLAGTSTPPPLV
jgi:hypothetical protein